MKTTIVYKKIAALALAFCFCLCVFAQLSVPSPVNIVAKDSVVTFASSHYASHSFLRRFLMGSNYRDVWEQYATVPVFYFSQSGFTIVELGGGMQTKSLRIKDRFGKDWSLRTIDKDVSQASFPLIKTGIGFKVAQDLISASFPYGSILTGELAFAAGIPTARPQIYFVADDTAFGKMRKVFANTLCMLEERDPGFDSTDNSFDLLENLRSNNQYKIQQPVLLKARLLDMLMADWDRHEGNWRWGVKDSAGFKFYYAIPRDRDWAFYKSGGAIPFLVQAFKAMPHLVNFKKELHDVRNLSHKAWMIDKELLNEMDAANWQHAITEIQTLLTNNIIEAAVKKLPTEIFELEGQSFINKLKSRRDALEKEAMKYYRFQAEEIIIDGSDKEENFFIGMSNDSLKIMVKNADHHQLYQRSFSSNQTYLITINGYGGADVFEIDEKIKSKIRILINGGSGADRYNLNSDIKTKVYDSTADNNIIINKGKARFFLK